MFLTFMQSYKRLHSPFPVFLLPPKWGCFSCLYNGALLSNIFFPIFSSIFSLVASSCLCWTMLVSLPSLQQTSPSPLSPRSSYSQPDIMKELPCPSITSLMFLSNLQSDFCLPCQSHKSSYKTFFFVREQIVYVFGLEGHIPSRCIVFSYSNLTF